MEENFQILLATWEQALGTVAVAISDTPSANISESLRANIKSIGEVMQATGNAVLSEFETGTSRLGSDLQVFGNLTVLFGIFIELPEETRLRFDIKGNVLQASGSLLALLDGDVGQPTVEERMFRHYAAILQALGNSLQALSDSLVLSGKEWDHLDFVGSWIQASGATLQALVQSRFL